MLYRERRRRLRGNCRPRNRCVLRPECAMRCQQCAALWCRTARWNIGPAMIPATQSPAAFDFAAEASRMPSRRQTLGEAAASSFWCSPDAAQSYHAHQSPHAFQQNESILPLEHSDNREDGGTCKIHELVAVAHYAQTSKLAGRKWQKNEECANNADDLPH